MSRGVQRGRRAKYVVGGDAILYPMEVWLQWYVDSITLASYWPRRLMYVRRAIRVLGDYANAFVSMVVCKFRGASFFIRGSVAYSPNVCYGGVYFPVFLFGVYRSVGGHVIGEGSVPVWDYSGVCQTVYGVPMFSGRRLTTVGFSGYRFATTNSGVCDGCFFVRTDAPVL